MNKQEQIEAYLAEPLKVGESVKVKGHGSQNPAFWGIATVETVNGDGSINIEGSSEAVPDGQWKKWLGHIGYNPFPEKAWDSAIRFTAFNLSNILLACGFSWRAKRWNTEPVTKDIEVPELNWNPMIVNSDGEEVCYQRDFVWGLEEKQLLIDSIYNGIEIGKVVIRKRSWDWVESRVKKGIIENTAFKDIVDGKQRMRTITDFVLGEFPDSNGMHFDDLTDMAQKKFMNFNTLSYGEIGETATDEDVKTVFVNINFAGVPMSQDHIDFVKNINLK